MINRKASFMQWTSLVIIIVASLYVRIYFLTDWLSPDECQYYVNARAPLFKTFMHEVHKRADPPLAFYFIKGGILLGTSAYHVKLVSLLSGLLAIVLMHIILRKTVQSFWFVQGGTLFFAILPVCIQQSIEARAYAPALIFVCVSLLFAVRICEHEGKRFSDHVFLAISYVLAFLTTYAAVLHVSALLIVLYFPLFLALFRHRKWQRMIMCVVPHIGTFFIIVLFFLWQFDGTMAQHEHVSAYTFNTTITELGNVAQFFFLRLSTFMNGIVPNPWGLSMLVLIVLPLLPVFNHTALHKLSLTFSWYSLLGIGCAFVLSLYDLYPFGGEPRHKIAVIPGIMLACIFTLKMVFTHWIRWKYVKIIMAAVIIGMVLPAFTHESLWFHHTERISYDDMCNKDVRTMYYNTPAPIVTDFMGRNIIGWWFFPERRQRLVKVVHPDYCDIFDYDGIIILEALIPEHILPLAIETTHRYGQSWLFLGEEVGDDDGFVHLVDKFKEHPTISVKRNKIINNQAFFLHIMKLESKRILPQ